MKLRLSLMVLAPILFGWLFNYLIIIPVLIYISPFLLLGYWFWVGIKFEERIKNPVIAVLLANLGGIASFVLYYWQFIILSDKERNLLLALLSQLFFAPLSYMTAKIVNVFGRTHSVALVMQIAGLVLMMVTFYISYIYKRSEAKR
jgi:hypothetical protein